MDILIRFILLFVISHSTFAESQPNKINTFSFGFAGGFADVSNAADDSLLAGTYQLTYIVSKNISVDGRLGAAFDIDFWPSR